jgi:hypothetical protein
MSLRPKAANGVDERAVSSQDSLYNSRIYRKRIQGEAGTHNTP